MTASLLNPRTSNIRDMETPLPPPKFYFTTYVVSGVGATGSFEIEFISTEQDKSTAYKLIPPQEGCSYLAASNSFHYTLALVSNTGSIYLWSTSSQDYWQGLAPHFEAIDENEFYSEKENEFDNSLLARGEELKETVAEES